MNSTDSNDAVADFLSLRNKTILIMGVANKKSVAFAIAKVLRGAGANVIYSVRSESRKESLAKLLHGETVLVCDVEDQAQIDQLAAQLVADGITIDGLVHSIAFADYPEGIRPFHETTRRQFLQAVDISAYSLISVCNALRDRFAKDASVVTIGISTTRMASESYGFMAPIKAALESSLAFLTKSFSRFSEVRFNAVSAGLLKTSASAGIPGYVDSYLYAEKVIPRRRAITTDEVANTAAFLLSPRSSGIAAQSLVVDAAMEINYFDADIVSAVTAQDID
ncbi:Enoyl-[acyl-carrier-protein] reductase [NADPH] FabI [Novipirellula galeiformis]|uniref:Enoyl-[acyl-carrier-protein] reductase [NADH] n=1 Tax=Novipirellula galeiformis TaxID=2528004 RepID=A0A5C6CKD5_9BACT|nr:SDR family oxidoreductase [Novipirellula galeiformis]TWU24918.1 Enoyl-[acyl-carrier-protein] reductase [NADPH] FabI [Novipirellula galeiformis]